MFEPCKGLIGLAACTAGGWDVHRLFVVEKLNSFFGENF